MIAIKYLITGHVFCLPDRDAKALLKAFPNEYRMLGSKIAEAEKFKQSLDEIQSELNEENAVQKFLKKIDNLEQERNKYKSVLKEIRETAKSYNGCFCGQASEYMGCETCMTEKFKEIEVKINEVLKND